MTSASASFSVAGLQLQRGLQRAAGVAVKVQAVVQLAVHDALGAIEAVHAQEAFPPPGVAFHRRARQTEEPLAAVAAVGVHMAELVDALQDMIFVELGDGDELGVLHVHQILGVEALGGELTVAEHANLPRLVARIGNSQPPDLVGSVQGHVIQRLGRDTVIFAFDLGVAGAVAGDGVVFLQILFHGPPGGRPEIAAVLVAQIDIAARLVKLVEHIAQDAARRAGLDEAVAARVLGHDGAVLRRAQVVGPGHGRAGIGDDVFAFRVVKETELHGELLLCL